MGTAEGCTKGRCPYNGSLYARYPDSEPPSSDDEEGRHHPGDLEINMDEWFDYHPWEKLDTNTNRRLHPEGFTWSCCGRPGGSPGCETEDEDDEDEY